MAILLSNCSNDQPLLSEQKENMQQWTWKKSLWLKKDVFKKKLSGDRRRLQQQERKNPDAAFVS